MPVELVERLVGATGAAFLLRARMRRAVFKPAASLYLREGCFCAEVFFEAPIGPTGQSSVIVMLGVKPRRELGAEGAA